MPLKDYYQILGVNISADGKDIKKAFRQLAMRYHPDQNTGNQKESEEKFKEINEAYEVLSEEHKRRHYDHLIGWSDHRQKKATFEEIFRGTYKDSRDLNFFKETMQTFSVLHPNFKGVTRRKVEGCKRRRGWRCRREQWQE
jgi:DnaJ-class molecular chaperone